VNYTHMRLRLMYDSISAQQLFLLMSSIRINMILNQSRRGFLRRAPQQKLHTHRNLPCDADEEKDDQFFFHFSK
jgi:hypothetical protein